MKVVCLGLLYLFVSNIYAADGDYGFDRRTCKDRDGNSCTITRIVYSGNKLERSVGRIEYVVDYSGDKRYVVGVLYCSELTYILKSREGDAAELFGLAAKTFDNAREGLEEKVAFNEAVKLKPSLVVKIEIDKEDTPPSEGERCTVS